MGADRVGVRDDLDEQAHLIEVLDHLLSRDVTVQAGVLAAELIDRAVIV